MNNGNKTSKDGSVHVTDEKFNTTSHLSAFIFSLLGIVLLIVLSSVAGKIWHIISFSIYGISLMSVFLASAFHHGINTGRKYEELLKLFDYLAIFLLIAGTYTPICLTLLRGPFGWSVFGVIWGVAAIGITLKAVFPKIPKWVTNTIYGTMGWSGSIIVFKLLNIIPLYAIGLIALGGIFYTVGMFIFYSEKPNPIPGKFGFHEIWHLFVIAGALTHYLFMYFIILPYN